MTYWRSAFSAKNNSAFTLVELIVVVAVLGVLAGIMVSGFSTVNISARRSATEDTVALMNRAILHFNLTNWDLFLEPQPDSTADELAILRTLQWRDPDDVKATPGSPYLSTTLTPTSSSDPKDFRIYWNGQSFGILAPGTAGTGLKVEKQTSHEEAFSYPKNYRPVTSRPSN